MLCKFESSTPIALTITLVGMTLFKVWPEQSFGSLVDKEWGELLAVRSWWLLLFVIGPLAGRSFISVTRTYAELSGLSGTAAGVGEVTSPLIGVWAPTFNGCELAAVFLLPFVAIRIASGDRRDGAPFAMIAAKAIAVLAGWCVAMLIPLSATLLWKYYGGTLYAPELITLIGGQILNAGCIIALGFAAASLTRHYSTAVIVTLSVTAGMWIVNFVAAVEGGFWGRIGTYTPGAMLLDFQRGLVKLETVLISLVLIFSGLKLAAIWHVSGKSVRRRTGESAALVCIAVGAMAACSFVRATWDTSENRGNSFPAADERALRKIHEPLKIVVHRASEDPRRADLDRNALSKLRRILPNLDVQYVSPEQTKAGYGEVWYFYGGRKAMSRMTAEEGVLETLYAVTGVAPPLASEREGALWSPPVAVPQKTAAAIFYLLWPGLVLLAGTVVRRKLKTI